MSKSIEKGDKKGTSPFVLKKVVNLAFDNPQKKATAYFGIIPNGVLEKIEKSIPNLPKELKGTLFKPNKDYSVAATLDSIRHLADEKNLSRKDIIDYLDRMSDTIVEFDTVNFDYYYQGSAKSNGLVFKKEFSDGTIQSFEIVSNKKRTLNLHTVYMENGDYIKKKSAETMLMDNPSAHVQDAGRSNFNNSITQTAEKSQENLTDYSLKDNENISYSLKETTEGHSIKEQLKQSRDKLDSMNVIASVNTSKEFKNAKEALEWALQTLKQTGYKTERLGFGTIIFDEKRLKNGLKYLNTREDFAAYALIPKILKKGTIIGEHSNHKARGYDTVTFAAPTEINGVRYNMAVVVRMEGKNYYKIHRVLMHDGGVFEYKKGSGAEMAAATTSVVDTPTDTTSKDSIPQKNIKSQIKNNNSTNFSLKGTNDISTKDRKELLDTIEQLKNEFEDKRGRTLFVTFLLQMIQ